MRKKWTTKVTATLEIKTEYDPLDTELLEHLEVAIADYLATQKYPSGFNFSTEEA